jgi:hypothetical protein
MRRARDALIESGNIGKHLVQIDILLITRTDQIVKCMAGLSPEPEHRRILRHKGR